MNGANIPRLYENVQASPQEQPKGCQVKGESSQCIEAVEVPKLRKSSIVRIPNALWDAFLSPPHTSPSWDLFLAVFKQRAEKGQILSESFSGHRYRRHYIAELKQARITPKGGAIAPIFQQLEAQGQHISWQLTPQAFQLFATSSTYTRIDREVLKKKALQGNYPRNLYFQGCRFQSTGVINMQESKLRQLLGVPKGKYRKPSHLKQLLGEAKIKVEEATSMRIHSIDLEKERVKISFSLSSPAIIARPVEASTMEEYKAELNPVELQALSQDERDLDHYLTIRATRSITKAGALEIIKFISRDGISSAIYRYHLNKGKGRDNGAIDNLPGYLYRWAENNKAALGMGPWKQAALDSKPWTRANKTSYKPTSKPHASLYPSWTSPHTTSHVFVPAHASPPGHISGAKLQGVPESFSSAGPPEARGTKLQAPKAQENTTTAPYPLSRTRKERPSGLRQRTCATLSLAEVAAKRSIREKSN